jgi:1-acyl-sn-glycerol-3-phosphate acyltransferase
VIPVVTWGPQRVFDPATRKWNLHAKSSVVTVAGPPVDLTAWAGSPPSAPVLRAITDSVTTTLQRRLSMVREQDRVSGE